MKRMYQDEEEAIYYLTVGNENYEMPPMPDGSHEGILRGIYKYKTVKANNEIAHVQLFGSGAILNLVLSAQQILAEQYHVSSDVWSVTSYNELRRDAQSAQRWNMLHPDQPPRRCHFENALQGHDGPVIAASDYVCAVPEQVDPWVPGGMTVLGTDGFGRSEARDVLRRHFEVDAQCITIAALYRLSKDGRFQASDVARAIKDLGVDPEKTNPLYA
jgi:pyruvate dehydrogenase E1 component